MLLIFYKKKSYKQKLSGGGGVNAVFCFVTDRAVLSKGFGRKGLSICE